MTILRLIDVILAPTLTLFQKDSLSEFVYQLRGAITIIVEPILRSPQLAGLIGCRFTIGSELIARSLWPNDRSFLPYICGPIYNYRYSVVRCNFANAKKVCFEPFGPNCTISGDHQSVLRSNNCHSICLPLVFFFLDWWERKTNFHLPFASFSCFLWSFVSFLATASAFVFEPKLFGETFAQQPKQSPPIFGPLPTSSSLPGSGSILKLHKVAFRAKISIKVVPPLFLGETEQGCEFDWCQGCQIKL